MIELLIMHLGLVCHSIDVMHLHGDGRLFLLLHELSFQYLNSTMTFIQTIVSEDIFDVYLNSKMNKHT